VPFWSSNGLPAWLPAPVVLLRERFRRRRIDRYRRVFVVFTLPENVVRRLDIARGPCIPRPGTSRPMVGVTRQTPGDPAIFEALASVLLGEGAAVWEQVTDDPPGRLASFSAPFVDAMARLNRETVRRQTERPGDFPFIFEPERQALARWMPQIAWDTASNSVPAEAGLLGEVGAWARVSVEKEQALYCWSGPGFNPWMTPKQVNRLRRHLVPPERSEQPRG
jgi:hypothetical protein